jgi:agmatine deiminase
LLDSDQRLGIADFLYSDYATINPELASPRAMAYGNIDRTIARQLHLPLVETTMVVEGGAFEVNGSGTILLTEATAERNPHLTRTQIEAEICRTLGQKKVIWLRQGLAQDPLGLARISGRFWGRGAGGHTDEFVRFVSADTVLLAWVKEEDKDLNPINQMNYRRMTENFRILEKATDQDGKPFTVVKMPLPELQTTSMTPDRADLSYFQRQDPSLREGETIVFAAAASYLNYVVTNGIVLLPKYGQSGPSEKLLQQDEQARLTIQQYFPGRRIVQIDPTSLNYMGGGMHCITQQEPVSR